MGGSPRTPSRSGDRIFWVLILVIAVRACLSLSDAISEHRGTRARETAISRDIDGLRNSRDRLRLRTESLERGNPDQIERELRDSGYDLQGTVRIVPAESEDGTAGDGKKPRQKK